jgi:alpha-glucosidase (family GH31 glycosyl hydrolase)
VFYQQSLDPQLQFPGDALWIDEFDEMGAAPASMQLANGRHWVEMRHYWFFLIAKALVQEGWDKSALNDKRPYVWVRGMTADAQRYASLWTGDIYPDHNDMQAQIRAMQLAGVSGFPSWGHDAGGFYDWKNNRGPDENLYAQWAMAFGSFAPIWKPHGMGQSRWPLDRSAINQKIAQQYAQLRYELMPYIYTAAHESAATGVPMARPLLLDYPNHKNAWAFDLQYLWGDSLLVAPNADASSQKTLWLPPGKWVDFYTQKTLSGNKIITVNTPVGFLPLYVKQGSIIPRYNYTLSTATADKQNLLLDVYTGADASASLIEDDDHSEAYRKGALQRTQFTYSEKQKRLVIGGATGNYAGAPKQRSYQITVYGQQQDCWEFDGEPLLVEKNENGSLTIRLPMVDITKALAVVRCDIT